MIFSVYTSCSINYLPKAVVLAKSFKNYHPDGRITLLLNDVLPPWLDLNSLTFDQILTPKDLGYSSGWVFSHNVMELCTAVKGAALVRLLEQDAADFYLYLDPDVCVYNKLDPVAEYMGDDEIGLVPHITKPETTDLGVEMTELSVAAHGTYNLGHLIIRKGESSIRFANWWRDRLDKYCYDEKDYGLFTDQRWCDLVPAIFDKVRILRQPNLDVASWNFHGKKFTQKSKRLSSIQVGGYPLLTYHYSGTGPVGVHSRMRNTFAPTSGVVALLEKHYHAALDQEGQSDLEGWSYRGDYFDNGCQISAEARKKYRRHKDLQLAFPEPYKTAGDQTYFSWLQMHFPFLVRGQKLDRSMAYRAFHEIFDEEFYLNTYVDVAVAVSKGQYKDALDHYVRVGSRGLFDPNHYFVSIYYFEQAHKHDGYTLHANRGASIENTLLWHYLTVGVPNGLECVKYFDSYWYLSENSDLETAIATKSLSVPLVHFVKHGDKERRRPSASFDPEAYLQSNPTALAIVNNGGASGAFGAFILLGGVPGRIPSTAIMPLAVASDVNGEDE
jgi:hypothetical protein